MSDIAKELGAELIKRFRAGTLNGQGGILVKNAVEELEVQERKRALRIGLDQLNVAMRLNHGFNVPKLLRDLSAEHPHETWFTYGEGI
jgi:hypothetical protein